MSAKITFPNPENVKNFPADPKAVMVSARGVIRVVIRRYFWDKENLSFAPFPTKNLDNNKNILKKTGRYLRICLLFCLYL